MIDHSGVSLRTTWFSSPEMKTNCATSRLPLNGKQRRGRRAAINHIYPGQDYSDDRGGYLVSPDSEEMLIGEHGYLPDEMFGLRGEN
jgi:hypothetical protein